MVYGDSVAAAIGMIQHHLQWFVGGKFRQSQNADGIGLLDFVVIGFVGKRQRLHALLFQVGFMDAREAFHQYGANAQVAGFHGGMLTA